jgi:hypothetical protein
VAWIEVFTLLVTTASQCLLEYRVGERQGGVVLLVCGRLYR